MVSMSHTLEVMCDIGARLIQSGEGRMQKEQRRRCTGGEQGRGEGEMSTLLITDCAFRQQHRSTSTVRVSDTRVGARPPTPVLRKVEYADSEGNLKRST